MPDLDIEVVIDKLLVFMVDELEERGATIKTCTFNFGPDEEGWVAFATNYPELEPLLSKALKVSISRGLIERYGLNNHYKSLRITISGQARGLSVKQKKPDQPSQSTFHVNVQNAHGPMQIGNGNTMSFEAFRAAALTGIEAADAPQEQKVEAKKMFAKVLDHPLLCSVLGGIASGLTSGLTGKG